MKYKSCRLGELFYFLPKTKIQAKEGLESGKYPFYTSSGKKNKFIDRFIFEGDSLILGDGGGANISYVQGKFAVSDHCYVLQAKQNEAINTKYAYFYLSINIRIIEAGFKGAALKNISKKYLQNIKIPCPSIEEQNKVAFFLNRIEMLIIKREQSITLVDEVIKSKFYEMFGSPYHNQRMKHYPIKSFGKVITGNTPSRTNKEFYNESYIQWIKTDNILENDVYLTDAKEYLSKYGASVSRIVEPNSILVACIAGSLSSIGRVGITKERVAFNQQINAIIPNETTVDPFFLYVLIELSKPIFEKAATKGMKKIITKSDFQNIKLIKPEYSEQRAFGDFFKSAYALKSTLKRSSEKLDEIFASSAQQAFKGEIDLSRMQLDTKEETIAEINSFEAITNLSTIQERKINLKIISDIEEDEILDLLASPSNLYILVDKWCKKEGLNIDNMYVKEIHWQDVKEKIDRLIEREKIEQIFQYSTMLLKVKQ